MKKLWLILLSVALVMALSVSAFAVDLQLSGSYYAAGMYQDRTTFKKDTLTDGPSTAFYYQRLRMKTEFTISTGLKLVTRFDAMERAWGAARSMPGTLYDRQSADTRAENENIAFDWAYIEYTSPIGFFTVGMQDDGGWGTVFSDNSIPAGLITWAIQEKGLTAFIQIVKVTDHSKTATYPLPGNPIAADYDTDKYQLGAFYEWQTGQAGLLSIFYRAASTRPDDGSLAKIYVLQPYAIINIGPVKIQAELDYAWGDIKNDVAGAQEYRVDNLAGWIDVTADLKGFYLGGSVAYVAGMDWDNPGVIKGGFINGGMEWNPTLILFNNEREYWAGSIAGHGLTSTQMNFVAGAFGLDDSSMYNAWFFQGRAGVRPIDKLDIMASISYAMADNKTLPIGPEAVSNVYGTEIDLIGTYKITKNLSYMIGVGYLFTGDYFKGNDQTASVRDNYIFTNKLTLTF
ncbi:MAG: hypothetical protein ACYDGO_04805 [Smithellaceae bacterium]